MVVQLVPLLVLVALVIVPTTQLYTHCRVGEDDVSVSCVGITSERHLPEWSPSFNVILKAEFLNCSVPLPRLRALFPSVEDLTVTKSPRTLQINATAHNRLIPLENSGWESVKVLNLTGNGLEGERLAGILPLFPKVEILDISENEVATVDLNFMKRLKEVDISGNPLDCTSSALSWIDSKRVVLISAEETLCALPPHQNLPKPYAPVRNLVNKVRSECKTNCSCSIAYIWEQAHIIHSKTVVNCSGLGWTNFPDPTSLPSPTDTLDLSRNEISSLKQFVGDEWDFVGVMNLHLDHNQLESIALLEGSDWFYTFQVLTLRNNSISTFPAYVLENAFTQNRNLLQIDLSLNPVRCDCATIAALKPWLLRHASNIGHIEEVRCAQTGEQIRYLKREDWCTVEVQDGETLIEILDIVSIILALTIFLVVGKVYYDYWNFKRHGKLPWLVTKM